MRQAENAIEVSDVKKYFKVYRDKGITLKEKLVTRKRNQYEKREVLKGISFDVRKGEAIGLIGKNGCGKSTTLKLLTRIIYPNEGTIELSGRVSSLLELGAGFHPDMSGRENIYMNASIFGLTKMEIDQRVHDIIKFSELEDYIDNPVRTYSSGMYMRLAFSVAINVEADILLIDEILAVGDISFQKKCFERLKEIKRSGVTIVIVSHSLDQIEKICDRSIWICDGIIREIGKPRDVHKDYLYEMEFERLETEQKNAYDKIKQDNNSKEECSKKNSYTTNDKEEILAAKKIDISIQQENNCIDALVSRFEYNHIDTLKNSLGNHKVVIDRMYLADAEYKEKTFFETGDCFKLFLSIHKNITKCRGTVYVLIYRDDDLYCYGTNSFIEKLSVLEFDEVDWLEVVFNNVNLLPGKYYFEVGIHDENAVQYCDISPVAGFSMISTRGDQGVARICSEWIC